MAIRTIPIVLATTIVVGCGGDPKATNQAEGLIDTDSVATQPIAPPPSAPEQESETDIPKVENITREALDRVLAAGPAAILGMVETAPVLNKGKFIGFRIAAFPLGPPGGIDLRLGDVVTRVNGLEIERPEQFFAVIEELRVAEVLTFSVVRDGVGQVLRYPVVK